MKIIWRTSKDSKLGVVTLPEGYFRFLPAILLRLDPAKENDIKKLSNEQKKLFKQLCSLKKGKSPLFKKIAFVKNEFLIELYEWWNDDYTRKIEEMIRKSWPEFFPEA